MEKKSSSRLALLNKYLEESPGDPFLLFAIAKEYEKQDETDHALRYYLELKNNNPDYVGTYYHLGKLYERSDQMAKAFFTYKIGMEVSRKAGDQISFEENSGAKMALGDDDDFE